MKKFNWKLLLVLALALVLVISLFACDPKTDDNGKEPENPDPGTEIEEADFFNELYAVGGGIGQQKIEDGKDVYFEAELGLALGTRADGQAAKNPIEIGIAVKALLDRQSKDHKDSAVALDLTVGEAQALSVYYKLSEKSVYLALGNQKVKVNTDLIPIGDMLKGYLNTELGGDPAKEIKGKSVPDYISELADLTGEEFELDTLVSYILQTFGLEDMIADIPVVGTMLDSFRDEESGLLSIEAILESDLIQSVLTATKKDLGNDITRYEASLGDGEIAGIDLQETIAGFLGAGAGVGNLGIKVSFDANKEHKLQEGGVKISADFKVDPKNELYASLPGEGTAKEFPFAEISIKHLNLQDGTSKSVLPADKAAYKDNVQLQADVKLALPGLSVGMGAPECPAKDLIVGAYVDLDLVNEKNNQTAARMFIKFKNNPLHDKTEYDKTALDLVYKNGRLAMKIDNDAKLFEIPAVRLGLDYSMILAGPIGNMIDGILEKYPTQKAIFDAEYWMPLEQKAYDYGKVTTGKTYNSNFKGFAIDGLDVSTIFGLLGIKKAGTAAEEALAEPEAPAEPAKKDTPIYNMIVKVFTLIGKDSKGNITVGCDSVMDLVTYLTGMDKTGLTDMLGGVGIVGTLSNYLYVTGISPTDGTTANPKVKEIVPELLDAPLELSLGFNDGISLNFSLTLSKPEGEETFDNHGTHIDATATIKFSTEKQTIEQLDLTELINTYKTAEPDLKEAVATLAEAEKTWDKFVAEFGPKYAELEETYKATDLYKTYLEANEKYTAAYTPYKKVLDEFQALENVTKSTSMGSWPNTVPTGWKYAKDYDTAYTNWLKAEKPESGATKDALDKAETTFRTEVAKFDNSKEILDKFDEWKPLLQAMRDAELPKTNASKAYQAEQQYKDYTTYQGTWTPAAQAINAARTAMAAVATQGFFYWDLSAKA